MTDINKDLDETLNLNLSQLKKNRQAVLEALKTFLKQKVSKIKTWTKQDLENELNKWLGKNKKGQYKPFCQVLIFYLEKKIKQTS